MRRLKNLSSYLRLQGQRAGVRGRITGVETFVMSFHDEQYEQKTERGKKKGLIRYHKIIMTILLFIRYS